MSNPISLRLELLIDKWNHFSDQDGKQVAIWKLLADENQMINLFFQNENSINKRTFDLFFGFDVEFQDDAQYFKDLVQNIHGQLLAYNETYPTEAILEDWTPTVLPSDAEADAKYLSVNLASFIEQLTDLEDNFVLFLTPKAISTIDAWDNCIANFLHELLHERIRVMLIEPMESIWFKSLREQHVERLAILEANLDMEGAMQEVSSSLDPSLPGAKFQKIFLKLSRQINQGRMDKAALLSEEALKISREQGWRNLQVAVHLQMGSGWLQKIEDDKALAKQQVQENYSKAEAVARNAIKQEDKDGKLLLVQVLFALGSLHLSEKNFEAARKCYEEIISCAKELEAYHSLMEAHRMTAYCLEKTKERELAWDHYLSSLESAENLDEDIRKNSTLPFTGKALLSLVDRLGYLEKETGIREKMIEFVGEDWESKIK